MDDDLVQFLRARLDEDEQAARTASHVLTDGAHWTLDDWHGREHPHSLIAQGTADQPVALGHFTADPVPTEQAVHIARHDPARVLAEVAAKRQIIEKYVENEDEPWPAFPLYYLALPYADHPDYEKVWRP